MTNQNSSFLRLIGSKPVVFNPEVARAVGSVKAGLFLCQLMYWMDKGNDPEWFYKSNVEWEKETALTRREVDKCVSDLKKLGLIEVEVKGVPPQRHFKVNIEKVYELVMSHLNCTVECNQLHPTAKLITPESANITESTPEITSKIDTKVSQPQAEPPRGGFKPKDSGKLNGVMLRGSSRKPNIPQVAGVQYGSKDINDVIAYLQEKMELPMLDGSIQQNRRFASTCLKKFKGLEKVKMIIDAAASSDYWRMRTVSMMKVYYNGVQIVSETRSVKGKTIHVK